MAAAIATRPRVRQAAFRSWPGDISGCTSRGWAPTGADNEIPIIVRGEGCYVYDEHGNRYLDGLSGALLRQRRPRPHGARRGGGPPGRGARLLHAVELRPPAGDRAGDADRLAGPRRPQPGLLHLRRLRGGRVGDEARPQLPPDARQRPEAQADRPRGRLPRHHRSGRSRRPGSPSCARSSSRSPPAAATFPTPTATAGPTTATHSGRRTRSRSGSTSRARRRSPR